MTTKNDPSDSTQPLHPAPTSRDAVLRFKQELYLGVTIKDRYLIEKELGRGGIGVVYLARDQQLLAKPVVIKVLLEEMAESAHNPWLRKKFKQEIEALARIDHPGVVGVLDAGELEDGKPYLVMQYVEGVNLRSVLQPEGLPFDRVAEIMRQMGQALSAAHDKGIYHRDLKPENIMLQSLGEGGEAVKLIDFGIAQVQDSQFAGTEKTRIAGALPYMAPEQLRGQPAAASDIFALGVIAYEMVTGRLPFYPGTAVEMYEMHQAGVQVKPMAWRDNLPAAAQDVILKALAFDPTERPARARDFGEALARALTNGHVSPLSSTSQSSASSTASAALPQFQTQALNLEIAHVLFMDLVGYSKLPMDQQTEFLHQLQRIVRNTATFNRAQAGNQLISLPTGDGMALVFFGDPVLPVQCAMEMAHALQSHPAIKLRLGINTGPVYRVADINANKNVSGGGINMAQRVMDCGDAGHILLSNTTVDLLKQVGHWAERLYDLGEHEVKHGARAHLFNLYTSEIGNPNVPEKLRTAVRPKIELPSTVKPRSRSLMPWLIAAVALLTMGIAAVLMWMPRNQKIMTQATPALASRRLTYSMTVQKYRDGKPFQSPFTIPGEMVVEQGWRVSLNLTSEEAGHLYLINESPASKNGLPDYNVLFPSPTANHGATQLQLQQKLRIPESGEFVLDNQEGAEKVWVVWSRSNIAELEALKKWANEKDKGEIKDANQSRAVQEFLSKHYPASKAEVERDDNQTNLKGAADGLLVHLIKLEHR